MSVDHASTAVTQPPPPLPSAPIVIEPSVCHCCTQPMSEGQECLIIHECRHAYHRLCIEAHLSKSAECPVCKKTCRLCDLRKLVIQAKFSTGSLKDVGRGAVPKAYNTRSVSRNLFQQSQNANVSLDRVTTPDGNKQVKNAAHMSQHSIDQTPNGTNVDNLIDYNEINRMIEQNISRLLHNMNLMPSTNAAQSRSSANDPISQCYPTNHTTSNSPNRSNSLPNSSYVPLPADKVASIIQNWNVKFDGTPMGLNIEEFLYRVRTLTKDNFNADFSVICRNLHILLTGKARDWYWRYHKRVQTVDWSDFCEAIRCQYREFKSPFDIMEEIRSRKQKFGEPFDAFFEAISTLSDKLPTPMSEMELIGILARNLRSEVRQDLLYVPVHSLSHLRKLVQMRENFLSEDHVRKNYTLRNQTMNYPRRISEIVETAPVDGVEIHGNSDISVDAIQKPDFIGNCWNCDETGHQWEDCVQERTIFCYGCGTKQVYKPNCAKCAARKQHYSKNLRTLNNYQEKT